MWKGNAGNQVYNTLALIGHEKGEVRCGKHKCQPYLRHWPENGLVDLHLREMLLKHAWYEKNSLQEYEIQEENIGNIP